LTSPWRLKEGREKIALGRVLFLDLGDVLAWGGITGVEAEMELAAGDAQRAYDALAEGAAALAAKAETGYLTTVMSFQAHAALELGRPDEATRLANEAIRIASADDFDPHARSAYVLAQVAARRGEVDEAELLLAAAAERVGPTDSMSLRFDLALARAEVARLVGRPAEAREALEYALALAERKENVLAADRVRELLATVAADSTKER